MQSFNKAVEGMEVLLSLANAFPALFCILMTLGSAVCGVRDYTLSL